MRMSGPVASFTLLASGLCGMAVPAHAANGDVTMRAGRK